MKVNFKYRYWSLFAVVVISMWGFTLSPKLPINLSLSNLLPDTNQNVIEMREVSKEVGGVGHLMVVIGPSENPQQFLKPLKEKLKSNPGIKYIFYEKEKHLLEDKALYLLSKKEFKKLRKNARTLFKDGDTGMVDLGLDKDQAMKDKNIQDAKEYFEEFKSDTKTEQFYLSTDSKYVLFLIKASFESVDLQRSTDLAKQVTVASKSVLKNIPFRLVGRYIEKVRDTKQMQDDIIRTGIISAIAISFILILGLGSFRVAFVTVFSVLLSMGWTIAFAYLVVGQINILTGFLLAILSGLGADYGIHLIRRYYQEKEKKLNHNEALQYAYLKTGRALFSAAITTAIAFFCLNISDFRGFSELGMIAGFGVISIFFVFMLTFPALGNLLSQQLRYKKPIKFFNKYPFKPSAFKYTLIVVPFIAYGISNAEFEYDFNRMRDLSQVTRDLNSFTEKLYGRPTSPAAILAPSKKVAHELELWLKNEKYESQIHDVISLATVVPLKMKSRHRKIKKLKKLLKDTSDEEILEKTGMEPVKIKKWLNTKPYNRDILPPQLKSAFGKSGNIVLVYPENDLDTRDNLNNFANLLRGAKKEFPQIKIGSDTLVFVEILDHIFNDGKYVLLLFLIGTFFTFILDFKNVKSSIFMEAQLILGILLLVGLMGLFGVRFTIMNVGMFPAILATGIDMAVHVRHRELDGSSPLNSASLTAGAINLSLVTTLIGFSSLFAAEANLLLGIAWIAVLGLFGMYFITMIFWPLFKNVIYVKKNGDIAP